MPQNASAGAILPGKLEVSVSAVSLALRNQPRVSESERKRIRTLVHRLGYRRDPEVARLMEHLRTARSESRGSTLAVVIPELEREGLAGYFPLPERVRAFVATRTKRVSALSCFS